MSWQEKSLSYLIAHPICGYQHGSSPAAEPTACAALALAAYDKQAAARLARQWLNQRQNQNGSLGPTAAQAAPEWPTALAMLAWLSDRPAHESQIVRAIGWSVEAQGTTPPPNNQIGHDPSIPGWSWVEQTHGWVEPTACHVLALAAAGHASHPRVSAGRRLLVDRLLPSGGCNYGNTVVLGQQLRPHLLPTGWALLALAQHAEVDDLISGAQQYLLRSISERTASLSLAIALQGLAAHQQFPTQSDHYLATSLERSVAFRPSAWRHAWALLASLGQESPVVLASQSLTGIVNESALSTSNDDKELHDKKLTHSPAPLPHATKTVSEGAR